MQVNTPTPTEKLGVVKEAAAQRYSSQATVMVAVGSAKVREALVAMIGALEGFEVVGEAASDDEAIGLARLLRPALAIVDVELPASGGIWAVERLAAEKLATSVIAIGMRGDKRTGAWARMAGAQAYLQTGSSCQDVVQALSGALRTCRLSLGRVRSPATLSARDVL